MVRKEIYSVLTGLLFFDLECENEPVAQLFSKLVVVLDRVASTLKS